MISEKSVKILIREDEGITREREPVRIGIPVPKGQWLPDGVYVVQNPAGEIFTCQSQCLKTWGDGSVKWLLLDFEATIAPMTNEYWSVHSSEKSKEDTSKIDITQKDDVWFVDTGVCRFWIDNDEFRPFSKVKSASGKELSCAGTCNFSLPDTDNSKAVVDSIVVEDRGPLHSIISLQGCFEGSALIYRSRLHFYAESSAVKIEITIHNPQAATHPKGLWDLGDPGSVFFNNLSFYFPVTSDDEEVDVVISEKIDASVECTANGSLSLYQESSGGKNWLSPNHRNYTGDISLTFKGYKMWIGDEIVSQGDRATPLIRTGNESSGVSVSSSLFWQEFPKKITASNDHVEYFLFPGCFPDDFELQGGEQKTSSFFVDFNSKPESLNWARSPLKVMPSSDSTHASGVFSELYASKDLVDDFVSAADFLVKREVIDEYGWRNFGDVYADHEAVEHSEPDLFISHYNNQYDFLAGAFRKAFSSEDFSWFKIASEMAEHVYDIDIYHTDQDREEYNNGLFWHTDHYVAAGLSTHRSYSREQNASYELHAGGGGPGSEHCYSTGLKYQYYLTGKKSFKEAVLKMSEWEMVALTGPRTLLASVKRGVDLVRKYRSLTDRHILLPRFPLTRGSGNAISTCLDAYELSNKRDWLNQAAWIINSSIHPDDDICSRRLDDIEIAWSYTVFLTAVVKFLDTKSSLDEYDSDFEQAKQSLLAYAGWMMENEFQYLDKPEKLEFPNETWAAQELRKSIVFHSAARYSSDSNQQLKLTEKAREFYQGANRELKKHSSSSLTRPVALLLQNGWIAHALEKTEIKPFSEQKVVMRTKPVAELSMVSILKYMKKDMFLSAKQFSVKKEINWLRSRV